ncbi:MAG: tetratricopeptide repeat protein [Acidobacteriota bacterium]|jgi:tetratricopeptide (TPR) repeat protein
MIRRFLAGMLLAAVWGLAAASDADLRSAREAKAQGRFTDAAAAYRLALASRPEDAAIRGELAQVLAWDGRFAEAIEEYRAALALEPGDAALLLGLARTYSWDGQYAAAQDLYAAYLEDHPDDGAVRFEAVRARSWAGEYEEAIAAYREMLEARPEDAAVRLELAKVLSWDRRYSESVEEYRRLLDAAPDSRDARLGLARVLSWSGRYEDAIREYDVLLDRDPEDLDARIGKARALAYSGDLPAAEAGYDAILAGRPEDAEALLGKAQLAWWQGDTRTTERLLARAEASSPGDADIEAFRGEVRAAGRPFLDSGFRRLTDTDGNDYRNLSAYVTFGVAPNLRLTPYIARTEAHQGRSRLNPSGTTLNQCAIQEGPGTSTMDALGIRFGWTLPRGVGMLAGVGVNRVDPAEGEGSTRAVGSVSAFGSFAGSWSWRAIAERRTFDATRTTLDCDVAYDALTGGVQGTWKKWRFSAGTGWTGFNDGNDRVHVDFSAIRPLTFGAHTLELGYRFRYMSYSEHLLTGYFDPQQYFSNLLVVAGKGPLGHPRVDYNVRINLGLQSFDWDAAVIPLPDGTVADLPATDASGDTVWGWEVRIGWNITDRARLEAYYGMTDYAAQSATGYESTASGLLFRYRF